MQYYTARLEMSSSSSRHDKQEAPAPMIGNHRDHQERQGTIGFEESRNNASLR